MQTSSRPASFSLRHSFVAAVLSGACLASTHAGEVGLLWGEDDAYHNTMLTYEAHPFWTRDFAGSRLDARLETSAGRVTAPSGLSNGSLWHVGLTPTARYWFTQQTGVELGIGANVFSGSRLGDKNISTDFQFGNSIGVFHRFASTPWTLGLRFTHYSNADIKRPNPGQDYLLLRVGYALD
ncbi:MAG TPA: acyloxyacyl hydrolase [Rhodocyclaceae bacterium]|nr:acyloxyacyl hydrolase [Rhodocyclaceae bacterium]